MGCFSKFVLFVLNFAVFVIGVGVITLASIILSRGSDFKVLLEDGTFTIPIILLILGICIMLLGFFGCFGALRESPCLLYTYATIVMILFIAQIAAAIVGLVNKDKIEELIAKSMTDTFNKYGNGDTTLTDSLDNTMHEMKCCGVYNYTDWYTDIITDDTIPGNGDVPVGCCLQKDQAGCNTNIKNKDPKDLSTIIYTEGCYYKLMDGVKAQALWLIIGAIVLALVQLGCITIACGIGKHAGRQTVY